MSVTFHWKKLVAGILFLSLSSVCWGDTFDSGASLNGKWRTQHFEQGISGLGVWLWVSLNIALPKVDMVLYIYDSRTAKEPFLSMITEGTATAVAKSEINERAVNIDTLLKKATLLIRKDNPKLAKLNVTGCAKVGVPLDLLTSKCGMFDFITHNKKNFFVLLPLDQNTLLMNEDNTREPRSSLVSLYPLVRQP